MAPTGWEVRRSTSVFYGGDMQIRAYLANQTLREDCADTATALVCQSPLADGLARGGMLVTWTVRSCVAKGCDLPPGALISIGNRQGVHVPIDFGCEEIGATQRSAYYVTVSPQRVDVLRICARDPSNAMRSALHGFLDGIRWRVP